eukprot:COSAG02_NODE_3948_length_6001_cov_23.394844_6_plen_80_part_00
MVLILSSDVEESFFDRRILPTLQCELLILKCNSIRSGTSCRWWPWAVAQGIRAKKRIMANVALNDLTYSDSDTGHKGRQ